MVHPCFLDDDGTRFPDGAPVPAKVKAHFRVLDEGLRATVHAGRLRVGVRFFLFKGRRIADCTVTELLANRGTPCAARIGYGRIVPSATTTQSSSPDTNAIGIE